MGNRSGNEKKLPNFLVAGVPKAGTTSLHHYLDSHPSIFMPAKKELHFFTSGLIAKNINGPGDLDASTTGIVSDIDEYEQCFAGARSEEVSGEVSPSYFYFARECSLQIKDVLNSPKVILMLRDPIERAFSNYLHLLREGRETEEFEVALELEQERKASGYGDFWRYTEHSLYSEKTRFILDEFGQDNVKIVLSEQLKASPERILPEIFEFIGVDPAVSISTSTNYNSSAVYSDNLVTRMFNSKASFKSSIMSALPDGLANKLRQFKSDRLKQYAIEGPKLKEETVAALRELFKADIEAMSQFVDTTFWKRSFPTNR